MYGFDRIRLESPRTPQTSAGTPRPGDPAAHGNGLRSTLEAMDAAAPNLGTGNSLQYPRLDLPAQKAIAAAVIAMVAALGIAVGASVRAPQHPSPDQATPAAAAANE